VEAHGAAAYPDLDEGRITLFFAVSSFERRMRFPKERSKTMPGLGDGRSRASGKAARVRASVSGSVEKPAQRWAPRQTMPILSQESAEGWPDERTRTMPRCLDEIGAATAAMAAGSTDHVRPRCIASPTEIRAANIGPRDAFVLSLLDGDLSLGAVLEISGMREDLVVASLDRLAGLGFVRF
jgi:hypothetical protein